MIITFTASERGSLMATEQTVFHVHDLHKCHTVASGLCDEENSLKGTLHFQLNCK